MFFRFIARAATFRCQAIESMCAKGLRQVISRAIDAPKAYHTLFFRVVSSLTLRGLFMVDRRVAEPLN